MGVFFQRNTILFDFCLLERHSSFLHSRLPAAGVQSSDLSNLSQKRP